MQAKKILVALIGVGLSTLSLAYTPQASANKYGLFLDSSPYSIPAGFWQYNGNSNDRILKPTNGSQRIEQVPSFKNALVQTYENITYSPIDNFTDMKTYLGYPSVYEYRDKKFIPTKNKSKDDPENQCVAFAKMMTHNNTWTGNWFAGPNVMAQSKDGSDIHRGKMVAYFHNKNVSYYKNGTPVKKGGLGHPVHVGIFLGYGDNGFWITDENWGGSADFPTGEIRKHFIPSNSGSFQMNAKGYYFVDIR